LEYLGVFEAFKDDKTGDRMPPEIVSLILKCMLYRTKGTFYFDCEGNGAKAFKKILKLLQGLGQTYRPLTHPDENPLTGAAKPIGGSKGELTRRITLRDEVNHIQKIGSHDCVYLADLGDRFGWAALRYFKMFTFVKNKLLEPEPDFSKPVEGQSYSFSELSPETIAFDNNAEPVVNARVYKELQEYLSDLHEDRIGRIRMRYQPVNPFSPPDEVAYIRRRIELTPTDANKSPNKEFKYRFIDSSPLGDEVRTGDWIVVGSGKALLRVEQSLDNHCISVLRIDTLKRKLLENQWEKV
jgi:hypothetical protein